MNNLSPNMPTLNGIGGRFYPQNWTLTTPIEHIRYEMDVDTPDGLEFVVPRYFMFETAFARRRGQAYLDEALTQQVPEGMVGEKGAPLILYVKAPHGIPSRDLAQCTVEIYIQYFRTPLQLGDKLEAFNVTIPFHITGPLAPVGITWLTRCQAEVYRPDGTGLRFQMPYWPAVRKTRMVLTWD